MSFSTTWRLNLQYFLLFISLIDVTNTQVRTNNNLYKQMQPNMNYWKLRDQQNITPFNFNILKDSRKSLSTLFPGSRRFLFSPTIQNTIMNLNHNKNSNINEDLNMEDEDSDFSGPELMNGKFAKRTMLNQKNRKSESSELNVKVRKIKKICFVFEE